jgi:MSHA pilin protein MshA
VRIYSVLFEFIPGCATVSYVKDDIMIKRYNGFTLIELVIVIVILGILSAVAFTKYINIQSQARTAKAMAVYGSIREASTLAKASCTLDLAGVSQSPTCTATAGSVNMDGTAVVMLNQYPDATLNGIIAATQMNSQADQLSINPGNPITIDINGGTVPNCRISYAPASAVGVAPIIILLTTGC